MQNPVSTPSLPLDAIYWAFGLFIGIIISLITAIYNFMNGKIKEIEKNQSDFASGIWTEVNGIKKDSEKIKSNYLQRFNEVNQNINESSNKILEKLNDFMIQVSSGKFPRKSD